MIGKERVGYKYPFPSCGMGEQSGNVMGSEARGSCSFMVSAIFRFAGMQWNSRK